MANSLPAPGLKLPPFLQLLYWVYRPIHLMEHCSRKHGDWFTLQFPYRQSFLLTSDPQSIRDVFAGDPERLHAGAANAILKPLLGSHSLLLLDGREHQRERKLLMPPFHGERIRSYGELMQSTTERLILDWAPGRSFPVHPEMQSITLEVIIRVVVGVQERERVAELKTVLADLLSASSSPTILFLAGIFGERLRTWPRWSRPAVYNRFLERLGQADRLLLETIQERRNSEGDAGDILSLLIQAEDEEGRRLSDSDLRDEIMTLLTAGHETTATALSWALWHLANRPDLQSRVAAELREASSSGRIDTGALTGLPLLEAVIKETLRLTPVIPLVGRSLQVPMQVASRRLPAGVVVAPCIYLAHRRPDLWEQPEHFQPERFLERRPRPYEFFPFGGGARYCLGAGFAFHEMRIVLAHILSRFKIQPSPEYRPKIIRRGVTLAPSKGVPIRIQAL